MSDDGTKKQIDAVWFRKQLDELDEGKPASLSEIRDLLLSDEFLDDVAKRMNEKLFATEFRSRTSGTVDLSNADNNSGVAKCQIQ